VWGIFLPARAAKPSAAAAPRHGKGGWVEASCEPGLDHLAQIPGDKGNDPDAVGGDHLLQVPRDRTAHQRADAELGQAKSLLDGKVIRQKFVRLAHHLSGVGFDNAHLPRHVEHRRNSVLPCRKGCLHRSLLRYRFTSR